MEFSRATKDSAGYDFRAPEDYELKPGEWVTIDTGIRFDDSTRTTILSRWVMFILPRSGLARDYGFKLATTVSVIDMDYRDNITITISVDKPYKLMKGERFAQGIIVPFGTFVGEVEPDTIRQGGHGSTGRI